MLKEHLETFELNVARYIPQISLVFILFLESTINFLSNLTHKIDIS